MSEAFELRRARPEDANAIRRLTREAYAKWVPVIGREPKPMTADYDAALRKHRFDLLSVSGTLAALLETDHADGRLLIVNLAVSPDFQRRGLGTRLMAHAEAIGRSLGCARLWLYTGKLMAGNVELYTRLGYRIDREEEIDRGIIRVFMSKPLAA
jgi:ribosomal protein S18 acetylase RimI-like enzyme